MLRWIVFGLSLTLLATSIALAARLAPKGPRMSSNVVMQLPTKHAPSLLVTRDPFSNAPQPAPSNGPGATGVQNVAAQLCQTIAGANPQAYFAYGDNRLFATLGTPINNSAIRAIELDDVVLDSGAIIPVTGPCTPSTALASPNLAPPAGSNTLVPGAAALEPALPLAAPAAGAAPTSIPATARPAFTTIQTPAPAPRPSTNSYLAPRSVFQTTAPALPQNTPFPPSTGATPGGMP